jgi:hypothetical protein
LYNSLSPTEGKKVGKDNGDRFSFDRSEIAS